jgi:Zn-dependent M32 family carboxypeptidase
MMMELRVGIISNYQDFQEYLTEIIYKWRNNDEGGHERLLLNINERLSELNNNIRENEGNAEVLIRNLMNQFRNRMDKGCIKEIFDDIHAGIIQLMNFLIVIKI